MNWSQQKLAETSGVGNATIRNFEAGRSEPTRSTLDALRRPLESAGVIFVEENGEGPGVRMKRSKPIDDHRKPVGPATDLIGRMETEIAKDRAKKKR